jgi:succinyl-diaminopimelate desuccinylase
VTNDELQEIYAHGLYSVGDAQPVEEMARKIEIQNLLARINLPMDRVEVRTDEGGNTLEIDIANLTLKHLLQLRIYGDESFARTFRYDQEDINRVRTNEEKAARNGLRAEIENPLTGKPIEMREFLSWILSELEPLARALNMWDDLQPLVEMAQGELNTAERIRMRLKKELHGGEEIPVSLLRELAIERQVKVSRDVEIAAERMALLRGDNVKLGEFLQRARDAVHGDHVAPIRFRPRPKAMVDLSFPDKTSEIVHLASRLVRIPSVTASPNERLEEVNRAATFIFDYLRNYGLQATYLDGKYPAVYAAFPEAETTAGSPLVMLGGHFDVVEPEPDDSQFEPRVEGDYLWGRGAADMKTVVATYLAWMKDTLRAGPPYPSINLLLVGNEENGEAEPMGTPFVLRTFETQSIRLPDLYIAGERTEEVGNGLWGEICVENRGIMRFDLQARGTRGHSGVAGAAVDLSERLLQARQELKFLLAEHLTLQSSDSWKSQARFPFIQIGTPGIYNVTPDLGLLGVEVRSIPQDNLQTLKQTLQDFCQERDLELSVSVMEDGVSCDMENPALQLLIQAVESTSGEKARLGKKLPGTSARFAPRAQGIVWGQSGIGPHSNAERHYIPSIMPYYQALNTFGNLLKKQLF